MASGAAVTALFTLVACAPEPEPEPELLTVSAAGARYLDAVCPVNAAWDSVDIEVDRLRVAVARPEPADTSLFAAAMQELGDVSGEAADRLGDPSVAWPPAAESSILLVRSSLEADVEQAAEVKALAASEVVSYVWQGSEQLAAAAASAREALGLPDDPTAACDAHTASAAPAAEPAAGE